MTTPECSVTPSQLEVDIQTATTEELMFEFKRLEDVSDSLYDERDGLLKRKQDDGLVSLVTSEIDRVHHLQAQLMEGVDQRAPVLPDSKALIQQASELLQELRASASRTPQF